MIQTYTGEDKTRRALLHGVPYGVPKWSTLKILFRMSSVDPCVSSIYVLAPILNSIVQQYLSLRTHLKKVSLHEVIGDHNNNRKLTFLKWVLRLLFSDDISSFVSVIFGSCLMIVPQGARNS